MADEIKVVFTKDDFLEDRIAVRVIYKKLKAAGIPVNPIGVNPVVFSGSIYRKIEEDKIIFLWRTDESN